LPLLKFQPSYIAGKSIHDYVGLCNG